MSLWYIILFILNYRKGFIMKRPTLHKLIFSILLFAISFLALFTSHKSSAFADWYSSTIYPLFVSSVGRFFGIFPFSVSEIGLYIFIILLFLSLIPVIVTVFSYCVEKILSKYCPVIWKILSGGR